MKIKLTNRRQLALIALCLSLALYSYFNNQSSSADVAATTIKAERYTGRQDPSLQDSSQNLALKQLQRPKIIYTSNDLFRTKSWYVPPPPPPAAPPPVPMAPPLPFTFLGKEKKSSGKMTFFLADQERVYLVHSGETISNNYHIDGIQNGKLAFTYLPMKKKQFLNISGGQ